MLKMLLLHKTEYKIQNFFFLYVICTFRIIIKLVNNIFNYIFSASGEKAIGCHARQFSRNRFAMCFLMIKAATP